MNVKRPEREAGYLPTSSAEVKIVRSYTSTPTVHIHGVVHGNNCNLIFGFYHDCSVLSDAEWTGEDRKGVTGAK